MGITQHQKLHHDEPDLPGLLVCCDGCSTTTPCVPNTCTYPGISSRHRADQCGGLRCQQGPLLSHGGEGGVREPVRALHREDLLHPEQGDLRSKAFQQLYRGHRDQGRACLFRRMSSSAIWLRPSTTRHWRRPTRYRGASRGRTECATPPTRSTWPRRMTTSALM